MTLKQLIGTAIALTFCLPMAVMAQSPDVLVPIAGSNAANDDSNVTSDNDIADIDVQDNFQDNSNDDNDVADIDVTESFQDNSDNRVDVDVSDSFQDNDDNSVDVDVRDTNTAIAGSSAANGGGDADTDNSLDVEVEDSFNTDNSLDVEVEDSFNTDNSLDVYIGDSFNTDNSLDIKIGNVALNTTVMGATASNNTTFQAAANLGRNNEFEAENEIENSFSGTAGITQTGQNLGGANSVLQQSVNVQSNIGQ